MLTGLLGIRLILLIGKTIPTPAPYEVSTALTAVEVTNSAEVGDGFKMTFTLGKEKQRDYGLLQGGLLAPSTRVILGVLIGAVPQVLIDGVIMHHRLVPSNDPGMSTLIVKGRDISVMLDLEEKNNKYENQMDSIIVMQLIARYAKYGLIPQVTPTTDIPLMVQRIPHQHETDLKFVQRMAKRNGFVFYIEPLTFGANTAYWGPENRLGIPQPALSMNMGPSTNAIIEHFEQDALAPVKAQGAFIEPITKLTIPIPSLPSLRIPPLVTSETPALRTVLLCGTANQDAVQSALTGLATTTNAPQAVSAKGTLETVRYGHVLRARKLVGVRGVGTSYDGTYYVSRVTHVIDRSSYLQHFQLNREGTGSLLPVVRP